MCKVWTSERKTARIKQLKMRGWPSKNRNKTRGLKFAWHEIREKLSSVVSPDISRVKEAPVTLVITLAIVVILVKDQERGVTLAIFLTSAK